MDKIASFAHYNRGKGRPQIVLVGNGLERMSGQTSWDELIDILAVSDGIKLENEVRDRIPFPLLYQLVSSHNPAPSQLCETDITEEENRLALAMSKLIHRSNLLLDMLPTLDADHIFTTNYSYSIEKAFYPKINFSISKTRSQFRFNLNPEQKNGKPVREVNYRMFPGYLAENNTGNKVGIWHIHGECTVPRGVIIGHDRYGRLLSRMETICRSQKYDGHLKSHVLKQFVSWPELFLYGDVYVIGLGVYFCEYDLWWLLRRKQRERYADGKVYFYDNGKNEEDKIRDLLMQSHGVIINPGITKETNYDSFYKKALADIREKIKENHQ